MDFLARQRKSLSCRQRISATYLNYRFCQTPLWLLGDLWGKKRLFFVRFQINLQPRYYLTKSVPLAHSFSEVDFLNWFGPQFMGKTSPWSNISFQKWVLMVFSAMAYLGLYNNLSDKTLSAIFE
jgi:hypothetical protein